ncbi:MuDR family transposase [Abeliophyllum distichum]|uniref:MuDR family transposase n=1 Tax=Abeliophyllum distichum TaxID=126358 RepID=A0ABD1RD87_9LAMI
MVARLRGKNPVPVYGENTKQFTIAWHYGGRFFVKPNNVKYEHGKVEYMDYVEVDDLKKLTVDVVDMFMRYLGYKLPVGVLYKREMMSLLNGLVRIKNMEDVRIMLEGVNRSRLLEVYLVPPAQTFALPWESPIRKWKTNVVIEEIVEPISIRVPESQPRSGEEPPIDQQSEDAYVPQSEDQEWAGVNWEELIDGVCRGQWDEDFIDSFVHRSGQADLSPDSEEGGNVSGRPEHSDHSGASEHDNLMDSDYETNEGNDHESQPTNAAASHVNVDMSGLGDLHDEPVEAHDTDYGESDELESLGSDGESRSAKRSREAEFNTNVDMNNPQFTTGLVFETKRILIDAVKEYSVINNKALKWKRNDKQRFRAVCKHSGCPFVLYARVMRDKTSWEIRTLNDDHTCPSTFNNKRVSSTYMARKYASAFRSDPDIRLHGFRDTVKQDCNVDISKWTFYRTKKKCFNLIRGSILDQYRLLYDYCEQLKSTNAGSTVVLERNEQEFKRLYVCLAACKVGFLGGCRKVIELDGCFLKSEYGGQLLSAVGIDGNNAMFPIAYAVVDTENGENWTWFLSLLGSDLQIGNPFQWTFISDKQKGLMQAVRTLFEESEHRTCVRHLYNNFKLNHKGMVLKHTLWNAARATNVLMWQKEMEVLKELNSEAFEWLNTKPAHQWSMSHFREAQKCDILLNNLCEAFNSSIVNAREKPILAMLEQIRFNLMIRMVNKKEEPAKWKSDVGPRIEKIIEKHRKSLRYLHATYSGDKRFEVRNIHSGHINAVDLVAKTCSCRSWQLSGVPCGHVICSLESRGMSSDLMMYVSDCYKKDAYLRTYSPSICPMTSPELWPNPGQHPLAPPPIKKMPGRPKKARRREPDEVQSSSSKVRRTGMKMRCRKCGKEGHNKRSCKQPQGGEGSDNADV